MHTVLIDSEAKCLATAEGARQLRCHVMLRSRPMVKHPTGGHAGLSHTSDVLSRLDVSRLTLAEERRRTQPTMFLNLKKNNLNPARLESAQRARERSRGAPTERKGVGVSLGTWMFFLRPLHRSSACCWRLVFTGRRRQMRSLLRPFHGFRSDAAPPRTLVELQYIASPDNPIVSSVNHGKEGKYAEGEKKVIA